MGEFRELITNKSLKNLYKLSFTWIKILPSLPKSPVWQYLDGPAAKQNIVLVK